MSKVFSITEGLENMGALRTGGQGSVYKGRRFGPIISAVKLLPTPVHMENTEDKNFLSFQNEVEKLKKVNEQPNPNVVKILHSGITESGSFPFIEMEYIEGPDLEELLKAPHDPVFSIKEVIKVADHLSNALAHCHKLEVKHGDIKSNNVKFNIHTGNYVLLDFGLSAMSDEQRRTSIRHAGAIEFMAPEQSEGHMLFETDVYSFGVVLYELLAGQVPFPLANNGHKSRSEVLVGHLDLAVPDPLELRRNNLPDSWTESKKAQEMQVPSWLLQLIRKCLEKLPANRYANGILLHDAIVHGSVSEPVTYSNSDPGLALLQTENERLQAQLLQYQNASTTDGQQDKSVVVISKPVFYVLVLGILFMAAMLSYFLLKDPAEPERKQQYRENTVTPDTTQKETKKGYSWDRNKDTIAADTEERISEPVQLTPAPPVVRDTTVLDLDTTVNF